jgi:hypothetical protein
MMATRSDYGTQGWTTTSDDLHLTPITFADAKAFIVKHHRHHKPPVGLKFCVGAAVGDDLVGVAVAGRPVARMLDDGRTLEVTRTATDGTPNANSLLYGAVWRAAKALGYHRAITYTQEGESGASLRGAGWVVAAELPPRKGWDRSSRPRDDHGVDMIPRIRWEITTSAALSTARTDV